MSGPRYGFVPDPGKNFSVGDEPTIAQRLDALAVGEHLTIFGISGYRTPAHSVAVGGFANDPHTQGRAADIGVNGQSLASAGRLSEATLNKYGLTRPFGGVSEINHVQLLPGWKGQSKGRGGLNIPLVGALAKDAGPLGAAAALGGKILQGADSVTGGAVDTVTGAANSAIDAGASATANAIVGTLADSFGAHAARILLYIVLIGAGAALAVAGLARAAGVTSGDAVKAAVGVAK